MSARPLVLACLGVVSLALGGCHREATFSDDVDLRLDFLLTPPFPGDNDEQLTTPYVSGAAVDIYVSRGGDDLGGWRVVSSDESVFRIDGYGFEPEAERLTVHGRAGAEGTAVLTALDEDGDDAGDAFIEVLAPDELELVGHGYVMTGHDSMGAVSEIRQVEGSAGTYLVRYYHEGRELHGNGALSAVASGDLQVEPLTSYLFENREWLTVTAWTAGSGSIELSAGGSPVASVPVAAVSASDVAHVSVLVPEEWRAAEGSSLTAFAEARDAEGRRILGAPLAWRLDGQLQAGAGDLFHYAFDPQQVRTLSAGEADAAGEAVIHASSGWAESSGDSFIGCSASGRGAGSRLAGFGALAMGALARLRRRR